MDRLNDVLYRIERVRTDQRKRRGRNRDNIVVHCDKLRPMKDHRPDDLDLEMEKPAIVVNNPSPIVTRPPTRSGRKVRRPQWYGIPFADY